MIHFITFGDSKNYYNAGKRLGKQIEETTLFDNVEVFNEGKLVQKYPTFKNHLDFCKKEVKGFGYWIWKSFLVYHELSNLNHNDMLVYLDAGCEINNKALYKLRLYIDYAFKNDFLGFGVENDLQWTKKELLDRLQFNNSDVLKPQCESGLLFIKKCNRTMDLMKQWYDLSFESDYFYITDEHNRNIQNKYFKEHRRDQSILSILLKKNKFKYIKDETWFSPNWTETGKENPIWAIRNNKSQLSQQLLSLQNDIKVGRIGAYNCDCVLFNYLIKIINPNINIIWENSDDCDVILKGNAYPPVRFTNKNIPIIYFSGEPFNTPLEPNTTNNRRNAKYLEWGSVLNNNRNNKHFSYIPYVVFALRCVFNDKLYINDKSEGEPTNLSNLLEITETSNFDNLYMQRIFQNKDRKYFCAWCASKTNGTRDKLFNCMVENDSSKTTHSIGKQYGKYPEYNMKKEGQNWGSLDLLYQYSDYKFAFAIENCVEDGYLTEKILNVFYSGAIPIYYGSKCVFNYFNKDAFIYVNDFESIEECVKHVTNLSDEIINKMTKEPIFKNNELKDVMQFNHYPPNNYYRQLSNKVKTLLNL